MSFDAVAMLVLAILIGAGIGIFLCWCLKQLGKHRNRTRQPMQPLQICPNQRQNIRLVGGSQPRRPIPVRLQKDVHELQERQPIASTSSVAELQEPLIVKEEARPVFMPLGSRGPPATHSEPSINECSLGKLLRQTHDCHGVLSLVKDLGTVDTKVPMALGTGWQIRNSGTFIVKKIVFGLNR